MKHLKILAAGISQLAILMLYMTGIFFHFRIAALVFIHVSELPDPWFKASWIDVAAGILILMYHAYSIGERYLKDKERSKECAE